MNRKFLRRSVLIMAVMMAVVLFSSLQKPVAVKAQTNWSLVWSDEFNGSGQPDPANWNYDVGNGLNPGLNAFVGWGNGEWEWYRPENCYQQGGNLVMRADYNTTPTTIAGRNWFQFSCRITSQTKRSSLFGAIEARIQVPNNIGTWPAFWMLGDACDDTSTSNYSAPIDYFDKLPTNWSSCGEIDIMEHRNTEPIIFNNLFWDVRIGVFPWAPDPSNQSNPVQTNIGAVNVFRTYRLEWTPTQLTWLIDGNITKIQDITASNMEEFQKPFHLMLNLALSGQFTGNAAPNQAEFPLFMNVDYVRVYQGSTGGVPTSTSTPPIDQTPSADFTHSITALNSTQAQISFAPTIPASLVDVHYLINGANQQNFRMTNNGGTWQQTISNLSNGTVIEYWFTYEKNGPLFDSSHFMYTFNGAGGPTNTPIVPTPTFVPPSNTPGGQTPSADFTHSITALNSTQAQISFAPTIPASLVDVHYLINGANQQNFRMTTNGGMWQQTISSLTNGTLIEYWFTYEKNGPLFDSSHFMYTFNGAGDTTLPTLTPMPTIQSGPVDFGPNVTIFDPSMSSVTIQNTLNSIFTLQQSNQFGTQRNAILFKPGTYPVDANIGFNTQISGLGLSPNDVTINHVYADAQWFGGNATQNFWRIAENMRIAAPDGINTWAVSQAAPFRRMYVNGQLKLDPTGNGWSSGGFIADSVVTGQAFSGSQQQYITRSSEIGSWSNCVWNCVFVGVNGAPAQSFPNPVYTTVGQAPVIREKPFLYIDSAGNYNVFVPALTTNTSGTTWNGKTAAGTSLPISQFFIVKPGATSADMNNALASGLNLLVTPGVYNLDQTVNVTQANTVILGMGLATFINNNGVTAINVADVDGVTIAGLLFDAGTTNAPVLLQVGPSGASASHAANPTALFDVFARIGGAVAGKVTNAVIINSSNVIIDNTWLWRADHGSGIGWTVNTADSGLIVNGANVTVYGLFVEHFQKYNVIWNANGGRVYFFQNELPYDPPNQAAYMNGATHGYAAYKVADTVTTHEAWGVGSYCYFNVDPTIIDDHSFEVPNTAGVVFHDLLTVSLGNKGTIVNIINTTGAQTPTNSTASDLLSYP